MSDQTGESLEVRKRLLGSFLVLLLWIRNFVQRNCNKNSEELFS